MKAVFQDTGGCQNWTIGKEYDAKLSFVKGFVSILDDDGAEQLIRYGSTMFKWD